MDKEERIRARAYEIWERAGQPQGREADHGAERQCSDEPDHDDHELATIGKTGREFRP